MQKRASNVHSALLLPTGIANATPRRPYSATHAVLAVVLLFFRDHGARAENVTLCWGRLSIRAAHSCTRLPKRHADACVAARRANPSHPAGGLQVMAQMASWATGRVTSMMTFNSACTILVVQSKCLGICPSHLFAVVHRIPVHWSHLAKHGAGVSLLPFNPPVADCLLR